MKYLQLAKIHHHKWAIQVVVLLISFFVIVFGLVFFSQTSKSAPANPPTQIVVGGPLFPLARELGSELNSFRIRRGLSLEANPFLRDHVIGGQAVLPTVCAIAWIANACEQLYPGYRFFSSENYRALKGIVFDSSLADEYVLDLKETAKNESLAKRHFTLTDV